MPSNPSNMCERCLRMEVDITDGIPKQLTIHTCKSCSRYLVPPDSWIRAEPESRELLAFCIKRIRGLNKVKLIDAGFVWTEPHSRRLKVKLTVQKEVVTGVIMQQTFVVTFIVHTQMCLQCTRLQTENTWVAVCQVRQKVNHKRSFYYLEQLILKHNAQAQCINIKESSDGVDFYFGHRSHALKFVEFLQAVMPVRYQKAEQLVSHDPKNNVYNYRYTFSIEIAPICREDLVCLPIRFAQSQGNINPLVLCTKISSMIHVIDPNTLQTGEITAPVYWRAPFRSVCTSRQLVEFIVLDISPLNVDNGRVARTTDLGQNDIVYFTRTHLGRVLKPGDTCLGYLVSCVNFNDDDLRPLKSIRNAYIPDVVLVRKVFPGEVKKKGQRQWRLKSLQKDEEMKPAEEERARQDYEEFLDELEHDPEARAKINLYKDHRAAKQTQQTAMEIDTEVMQDAGEEDEDNPDAVKLEELLEDLSLNDEEDDEGAAFFTG